ncbi:SDR family NAD(P)-dependent oxidoreductase [Piscinibacter koreensis]|uniref:SDR family oxidoreductase n=1 Tax=Piscinibacter koreensis TaxID=2742824 RepID=A0A7Y6NRK3_9BURK|nr:SDR family NAD(P)-dependent oxidoreductase [Schlegelella koreensis]NUZ08010.1 SDR family oxidoreductase [Schlegelella koreensis]
MHRRTSRFEGEVAVVTGAASGIGQATAVLLASEGADLVLVDVADTEQTQALVAEAGTRAVSCLGDVADPGTAERARESARSHFGVATVLVNVAGLPDIAPEAGIECVDLERWQRVLAVNLTGPFLMARALLPGMRQAGRGAIVNVSSMAGRLYSLNATPAYTSSKAGLLGLTRHLASDYGMHGIRVNAICPGSVDTPMLRGSLGGPADGVAGDAATSRRRDRVAAVRSMTALGRMATAREQALAIAFLASSDAAFVTGVALDTNGGFYMA